MNVRILIVDPDFALLSVMTDSRVAHATAHFARVPAAPDALTGAAR